MDLNIIFSINATGPTPLNGDIFEVAFLPFDPYKKVVLKDLPSYSIKIKPNLQEKKTMDWVYASLRITWVNTQKTRNYKPKPQAVSLIHFYLDKLIDKFKRQYGKKPKRIVLWSDNIGFDWGHFNAFIQNTDIKNYFHHNPQHLGTPYKLKNVQWKNVVLPHKALRDCQLLAEAWIKDANKILPNEK